MIKIIHQTTSNGLIPINLIEYVSSLIFYHPTWKYMLWDDDASLRLIQSEYNFIFKILFQFLLPRKFLYNNLPTFY
jgi:mannosyltransferase OCH1-like enzyme